jgi:hypothetical protein
MEENDIMDIEKMAEDALLDESNAIEDFDNLGFDGIEGCED